MSPPFITTTMIDTTKLIDSDYRFDENSEGLVLERFQAIPDQFLSGLRDERARNRNTAAGEMHRVASIPVAVVDKWKSEGRDFDNAKVSEILKWLREENLDAFICSDKV